MNSAGLTIIFPHFHQPGGVFNQINNTIKGCASHKNKELRAIFGICENNENKAIFYYLFGILQRIFSGEKS